MNCGICQFDFDARRPRRARASRPMTKPLSMPGTMTMPSISPTAKPDSPAGNRHDLRALGPTIDDGRLVRINSNGGRPAACAPAAQHSATRATKATNLTTAAFPFGGVAAVRRATVLPWGSKSISAANLLPTKVLQECLRAAYTNCTASTLTHSPFRQKQGFHVATYSLLLP
jgi:hypothetical protein